MPEIKNLNVAPYFDDFNENNNFVRTLFRPGFAIQARELSQLQSVLQNQIERHGNHIFKDGAMVIPGQISLVPVATLKLENTFSGETIDPSQYVNDDNPVTITGATSGASGTPDATADSAVTLANASTITFTDGYANPELAADSGDIIYKENRRPISRATDQTEDIKIIVEF